MQAVSRSIVAEDAVRSCKTSVRISDSYSAHCRKIQSSTARH